MVRVFGRVAEDFEEKGKVSTFVLLSSSVTLYHESGAQGLQAASLARQSRLASE